MLVVVTLRIGLKLLYNKSRLCVIQDGRRSGRVALSSKAYAKQASLT